VPYAQRLCEAALRDDAEQALAHYLLSLIADAFGNPKQAVLHLTKVVELTPTFRDAWVRLGTAHRKAKNTAALEALDAKYRSRFAQPLP
jgi:tetratricopeptide (TPR) repeat protein